MIATLVRAALWTSRRRGFTSHRCAGFTAATFAVVCLLSTVVAPAARGQDYSFSDLHNFTGSDGATPFSPVVMDREGNLYGRTSNGGSFNAGTVYELINNSGSYTVKLLYSFAEGTDGLYYSGGGGLLIDSSGNLYGTTEGTVFELVNSSGSYTEMLLHSFSGSDGAFPEDKLIMDSSGNLYGTTQFGGYFDQGTVFELVNSSGSYTEKVLYSFGGNRPGFTDGTNPFAGLIMDSSGNLYGTTLSGGTYLQGTVFELVNSSGSYAERQLYSFAGGSDGAESFSGVIMDNRGNLYGTTSFGGSSGVGTVFELVNSSGTYTEKVLYSFAGGADGAGPHGSLTIDSSGNLFGTTAGGGGVYNLGTVFELANKSGSYTEKVLHSFAGVSDGFAPLAGLLMDSSGNLYGTAFGEGSTNCAGAWCGTVFQLTVTTQGLDSGPWPTLAHDDQRTNRSNLAGPSTPGTPTSLYDAGAAINSSPIVTSTGNIVIPSCSTKVVAINPSGGTLWTFPLQATYNESAYGLTASSDGAIHVSVNDCPDIPGGQPMHFYSLSANGTLGWSVNQSGMYGSPAIAPDGTIYQGDEFARISAYNPATGAVLWTTALCCFSNRSIALDSNGNLYVATDGGVYGNASLWSLTPSGTVRWSTGTGNLVSAVVGPGDVVYAINASGTLFCYHTDGSVCWPAFNTGGSAGENSLAVSSGGTVYAKTSLGLSAINPDGTSAWSSPFSPGGDASLSPSAVVDGNGNIFVAFGNNVYSLDPSGNVRSGWPVAVPSAGQLLIGGNGVLYVVSAGQKLYAISSGAGSGGLPAPVVSLSPTSLGFPNQTVNTTSNATPITVTNTGNAALDINAAPSITGSYAADFGVTSGTTCTNGAIISAGNSCIIEVTFTPSTVGAESATLSIYDNAAGSLQTVGLTGTGVAPPPTIASFSPSQGVQGEDIFMFRITGTNFQHGATISFSGGQSIVVDSGSLTVISTEIDGDLKVGPTAAGGLYDVTVTNPDGQSVTHLGVLDVLTIPPPPQHLAATVGNQSVTLRWDIPQSIPEGYNVYADEINGTTVTPLGKMNTGVVEGTTYSVGQLDNGQTYRFKVTAVGTGGESQPSAVVIQPNKFVLAPGHPSHPILFLHGFDSDASVWQPTAGFLEKTLHWTCGGTLSYGLGGNPPSDPPEINDSSLPQTCGFQASGDFFTVNFGNKLANYPDDEGIFRQGDEVGGFIREIENQEEASIGQEKSLSIVAWSMGGLAARAYIQLTNPKGAANQINDLVTLGTPHFGVNKTSFEALGALVETLVPADDVLSYVWPDWQEMLVSRGLSDMDGGCVANGDSTNKGDVSRFLQAVDYESALPVIRYVVVSGTGGWIDYPDICVPGKFLQNDLAVPTTSSTLAGVIQPPQTWWPIDTPDDHFQLPQDVSAILCALDNTCLELQKFSPVDIQVTAPNGQVVSSTLTSMPGAEYLNVINGQGHEDATVLVPFPEAGQFIISVTPKPGSQPTDTFTITMTQNGVTTTIADHMQIQSIPTGGFHIMASGWVPIEIKPGENPNSINPGGSGAIPVAILSTPWFDAPSTVVASSLRFGHDGTEPSLSSCHSEDVNGDGLPDLVCHFYTQQTGFQQGDRQGVLTGKTVTGQLIRGTDPVNIVE